MKREEAYTYVVKIIASNIGNRKLVLRWKNPQLEEVIFKELGLKAQFYVTRDSSRINNIDTFSDAILIDKSDKYYLYLDLRWNNNDSDRYKCMGYSDTKDICWFMPKPKSFSLDGTEYTEIKDEYGSIKTKSKVAVKFEGINSSISIGKNVSLPNTIIRIGSGIHISIKDNCKFGTTSINIADGGHL